MKKLFVLIIIVLAGLSLLMLMGMFTLANRNSGETGTNDNVKNIDQEQIITIKAKGGYYPRTTKAKANIPSIIRMDTNGTYDCSAALTIPAIDYNTFLPANGETDIKVPPQAPGTTIRGVCSMGMYSFTVKFE